MTGGVASKHTQSASGPISLGSQIHLDFPTFVETLLVNSPPLQSGVPVESHTLCTTLSGGPEDPSMEWSGARGRSPCSQAVTPLQEEQVCCYLSRLGSLRFQGSSTAGREGLSQPAPASQWPCAAPSRRCLIGGCTGWAGGEEAPLPWDALKRPWRWQPVQISQAHRDHEQCGPPRPSGDARGAAFPQVFPLPTLSRKQRTVLVVCGPEQNGAVGLVCARHLRVFEYEPTIFYPTRSLDLLHRDLTTQCEKMDIPFLSYLPTEVQLINDAYGLVVDAVLGPGVQPGEIGGPCTRALATLKLLSIPLVSLDIPSGWDAETGGGDSEDGLRPDVLVSLAAPKRCAGRFSGRHHFVAGRFVPDDVRRKFALRLPGYTGTDCVAAL
uniref:YjeF N-terminal domain-containing protein 3 n=2 Tax=Canis lupus familiaris TaxID=9615 RepID=A0A8P0NT65_CANLF|eukprot:XP_022262526.1 yjeF N-terminal domain-containing protein 3 isoform X1 [Canis lupus familiaris]